MATSTWVIELTLAFCHFSVVMHEIWPLMPCALNLFVLMSLMHNEFSILIITEKLTEDMLVVNCDYYKRKHLFSQRDFYEVWYTLFWQRIYFWRDVFMSWRSVSELLRPLLSCLSSPLEIAGNSFIWPIETWKSCVVNQVQPERRLNMTEEARNECISHWYGPEVNSNQPESWPSF